MGAFTYQDITEIPYLVSRQAISKVRTTLSEIDYSFIEMMLHVILRGHWKAQ